MKRSRPSWPAIRSLMRRHETKIRFAIIGAVNTTLGLGVFPALYLMLNSYKVHYILVLLLTNVICVGFAYLSNKFFVFKTSGNYLTELRRFITFHLSIIALSLVVVPALVEFAGISPIVAQPFFAIAIVLSSYFWHRYITFETPKSADAYVLSHRRGSEP